MIDIHCHLLPGIDDGASTLEQSLHMARLAVEEGITHAVLTPHICPGRWENTTAIIAAATATFRQALTDESIPLQVECAAEVRISDQIFGLLAADHIPYVGEWEGYRVMLLEFPHTHILPGTDKLVDWLIRQGIRPLIAHPERNRELMQNPDKLRPLLDKGCLAQLTGASITGRFGTEARAAAEYYIRENLITLIASDAHNTSTRPPAMAAARERIGELVGEEAATRLAIEAPRKLAGLRFGIVPDRNEPIRKSS